MHKIPGFNAHWEALRAVYGFDPSNFGRILFASRGLFKVQLQDGLKICRLCPKLSDLSEPEPAAVGDWVGLAGTQSHGDGRALIEMILPRKTVLKRKDPSQSHKWQVLAANLDILALVTSTNGEFNLSRIERYLAMCSESSIQPIVILTKIDQAESLAPFLEELEDLGPSLPIYPINGLNGEGIQAFRSLLLPGQTIALFGSSGVGKSTLVNHLLGQNQMETGSIRQSDQKGRHTTTHREILGLQGGVALMDTPGLRELAPHLDEQSLVRVFDEIGALAPLCKFRNCSHEGEPGCAVEAARQNGHLDERRYRNYQKLKAESAYQLRAQSKQAQQQHKKMERVRHRALQKRLREKGYS